MAMFARTFRRLFQVVAVLFLVCKLCDSVGKYENGEQFYNTGPLLKRKVCGNTVRGATVNFKFHFPASEVRGAALVFNKK